MASIESQLEAVLGTTTLPLEEAGLERTLRERAVVEAPSTLAGWFTTPEALPYGPLARRGLLIGFDAEGSYHREGAHAQLGSYLLHRAGLQNAEVSDRRPRSGGLTVTIRTSKSSFEAAEPNAHDTDYCFAPPVIAACNAALKATRAPFRLLQLVSNDQGVFIALLPPSVLKKAERVLGELVERPLE